MKGKRILISCNRTLNLGGIEKALTTFLRAFNTDENEVFLVLHNSNGILQSELPLEKIKIFYTDSIDASQYFKDDLKHFRINEIIKGLWNRVMLRLDKYWYAQIMYTYHIIKRGLVFPGHFDCAISFTSDYSDLSIVLSVDADKRISFVHGDATQGIRAAKLNDKLERKIDKIYCVSEKAKDLFLKVHPSCIDSVDVMHNVIIAEDICKKANDPADGMILDGTMTLCTVGRLSPEKGQQMIPEIAEMLKQNGFQFRWYLVGDGSLRESLHHEISKRGLEGQVILLGGKQNPYPYMKNCDIYVQPSLSEAYCTTTAEAKVLYKPIITTDAPGMREQLIHEHNGLIVPEISPKSLYDAIYSLFVSPDKRTRFSDELHNSANTMNELEKIYEFIEG